MKGTERKQLLRALRNRRLTLDGIAERLKRKPEQVEAWITQLRDEGVEVIESTPHRSRTVHFHVNLLPTQGNVYTISKSRMEKTTMRFAASSDWHFASIFHLPRTWRAAMDRVRDEGINTVYVAGDLMDGVGIYRGHLENLVTPSVEHQTDIVAKAMARYPDITFWGIAGNHDYSFTKQNGIRPLALLEAKSDNFKNLGDLKADVIYDGVRVRMLHGAGGRAYATSYPTQTYLRDYFKGLRQDEMMDLPDIMIVGHYHTLYVGHDHGMWILQCGSFQDGDNEYCVRRGLTGPNGLFLVEATVCRGDIQEFQTRYIQPTVARSEKGSAFAKTSRNYSRD